MSEATAVTQPRRPAQDLGSLPEWDLNDLYPAMDSDEVKRDLEQSLSRSEAFESRWKGRLDGLLDEEGGAKTLAEAIAEFEELQDLLGRLISYAGLQHALQVGDPVRAKFYGDVQEKLTNAGVHLLFFPLELNRISDERIEAAMRSRRWRTTGRGSRTSARRSPTSSRTGSSSSSTRRR